MGTDASIGSQSDTFVRDVANTRVYPVNYLTDYLVVGSNQLDDAGGTDRDKRMFFNKAKGALRAGEVQGSQWNNASVGTNSVAFGTNCTASGTAALAGGIGSTASGSPSFAYGDTAVASGYQGVALGQNTASGDNSTAFGRVTTASGIRSTATGEGGTASGSYSMVVGVQAVASRHGQFARGAATGSQTSQFVATKTTTTATPAVMHFDGSASATLTGEGTNVLTIPVSRAHRFVINAVARRTDTPGTFATWKIEGSLVRSSSGNARFISTPTVVADEDAGAAAWDLAVSINTSDATNNYLVITATGEAGATIKWVADITTVEVG